MIRHRNNWDLPAWVPTDLEELKLYGKALLSPMNPVATTSTLATLATKKAIEKTTGTKMTKSDLAALENYNNVETQKTVVESVDKHIFAPITGFFGNLKLILLAVIVIIIFVKFK